MKKKNKNILNRKIILNTIVIVASLSIILLLVWITVGKSNENSKSITASDTSASLSPTVRKAQPQNESSKETDKNLTKKESPTQNPTEVTNYYDGLYKVGTDIPAGEYVIISSDGANAHMILSKTASDSMGDIILDETFSNNTIATIEDGTFLTLKGAYARPISENIELDTTKDGMYKVGLHIPAGKYTLINNGNVEGYAYVEITKDSLHNTDSILSTYTIDKDLEVTLEEGQYIKLIGARIK
ncbi:hypothetical protein [Anaeromicropila herbilytica]|uniref:Cell surface protein n=1 Tax=Anaeromicropila herbilytica TaxID=2785025 RepID=A0A7R7IC81_9FIRM|nr:hypothetical protein [Anaeromicropila herbilytica]BCN29601.1 hypothetical protein bsdtb5_08960 [Anaeromicropila herbilytica]